MGKIRMWELNLYLDTLYRHGLGRNTINVTYFRPGPGHPDGALRCGHPVHVPLGPDAHAGAHGQTGLGALLYGPLHLLDMLEILTQQEEMTLSRIKDDY